MGRKINTTLLTLGIPKSVNNRSATNSMYCFIKKLLIPMRSTGKASVRNSCKNKQFCSHVCPCYTANKLHYYNKLAFQIAQTCSMPTALVIISFTLSADGFFTKWLYIRQAKLQCNPCERKIIWLYYMELTFFGPRECILLGQTYIYLISADKLIGVGESRHQSSFLQPEDGSK